MRYIFIFFFLYFFLACSSEEVKIKKIQENNETVELEKTDEKSELSDTNLPLPVEEK
ncbi:cytochrome C [uncultured Campylobacter sp.]|uniref:cytochrome C n=1 Tax=uncultured Campylobacter sp. TaxID=218934 RepID=UPI002627D518|nr:cytochrome C [uncultured Campylobacter sp.]